MLFKLEVSATLRLNQQKIQSSVNARCAPLMVGNLISLTQPGILWDYTRTIMMWGYEFVIPVKLPELTAGLFD